MCMRVCVWRACMCACVHACVWSVTSISTLFHMLISIFISIFMMTGHLIARHREIFSRNPLFIGMRLPEARELEPLERRYPRLTPAAMDIIKVCLCISHPVNHKLLEKCCMRVPSLYQSPSTFLFSSYPPPALALTFITTYLLTHATVVTKVRPK